MPTEIATAGGYAGDVASRRILRLALGTALALWFSQAFPWTLSFIAPIFTMMLLATPRPAPGLKAGVAIVVLVTAAVFGGLLLLPILMHQTAAGILLLGLALFHAFHFAARGGNPVLATLIAMGLTLTVAVGSVSVDAVIAVAQSVTVGAIVGVVFVWIAHAILPEAPGQPETAAARPVKPDPLLSRRAAMRSLAIVLPVAIFMLYSSDSAAYFAVMIKVISMAQQAGGEQTREAARSLLAATLIGGFAAVIGWIVLGVWPLLLLYVLLIGLAGLLMGPHIFAGRGMHEQAGTWSYAYLTMIVILAPAVADSLTGSSASVAFLDRLAMFAAATVYGVGAVYIFDAVWPAQPVLPSGRTTPAKQA